MIDTNPGDWYNRSTFATGIQDITRHYRDRGYAKARIIPQSQLDTKGRLAHITVQIERGPPVTQWR